MQLKNRVVKYLVLGMLTMLSILCSCRKCLTCYNECFQVYTYDTTLRKYDTLCSENYPSWQIFIDTLNGARGGYLQQTSVSKFSSCDASSDQVKKAFCQ